MSLALALELFKREELDFSHGRPRGYRPHLLARNF